MRARTDSWKPAAAGARMVSAHQLVMGCVLVLGALPAIRGQGGASLHAQNPAYSQYDYVTAVLVRQASQSTL